MKVPMELFATNRRRLVETLRKIETVPKDAIILLQAGGNQGICKGDSGSVKTVFRQESYFHWAFGVLQPDYFGAIQVSTGEAVLFMEKMDHSTTGTFKGDILSKDDIKDM